MEKIYRHLGIFSDIVEEAGRQAPLLPLARPGAKPSKSTRGVGLVQSSRAAARIDLRGTLGERRCFGGGAELGYRLWAANTCVAAKTNRGKKACYLGCWHCTTTADFKFCGKEKIAEGALTPEKYLQRYRERSYGGRAWANALAREGFVVLVHDTFLWGSRRFPLEVMVDALQMEIPQAALEWNDRELLAPQEVAEYNFLCGHFEHIVEKYLNLLGTCLAGVVAHEDRIALNVLRERPEVQAENLACMGLSGGETVLGLLRATAQELKAAVIVGLMSTYSGLFDHNVQSHTWMFFPSQWSRHGDWPDLVACQAPAPLLVQYDLEDDLFTEEGMRAADARLASNYASVGRREAYTGQFYPGPT